MDHTDQEGPAPGRMDDALLDDLRTILAAPDRERSDALEARIRELEHRTGDDEALVAAVSPILGDAIRRQVREDREEMVESIYPLIGSLIARAVAESIRDLARTIDQRMRTSVSPAYYLRRLRARAAGVSGAELALRDVLPFNVTELFLVHRDSGLLLLHLDERTAGADGAGAEDSDLVSGMLTAIRDFAAQAFGRGEQGQLDEIQYGNRRILIEAAQHVYLAVVVDGVEPVGFREKLRGRVLEVEHAYMDVLKQYDGDASHFAAARPGLEALMVEDNGAQASEDFSGSQKRIVIALAVLLALCLLSACAGSVVLARRALSRPAYMVVVTATPGPTATATATTAPTATTVPTATATETPAPTGTPVPTETPTPEPTVTPLPTRTRGPAPQARTLVVVNMRQAPGMDAPIIQRAPVGSAFTIVGRDATGGWIQVCCTASGEPGWLAAALVEIEGWIEDVPVVGGG